MTLLRILLMCVIGVGAAGADQAMAGAFEISPVRIALSARTPIAALTVHNKGTEASVMQLQAMAWSQSEGQDIYVASDDVLATPPIFSVAAGASHIVRIGLRRAPDAQRELSYRLFLQEVPSAEGEQQGIRVTLRFGIPVFVAPAAKATAARLEWRILAGEHGLARVEAINHGELHLQLAGFALALTHGADRAVLAERHGMDYLLPKQRRHWQVQLNPTPPVGASVTISAHTDAGKHDAEAQLEH